MSRIMRTQKKIEKAVVSGYKAVETGVVSSYKNIEDTVVGSYKKIENRFVDTFLTPEESDSGSGMQRDDNEKNAIKKNGSD